MGRKDTQRMRWGLVLEIQSVEEICLREGKAEAEGDWKEGKNHAAEVMAEAEYK